MSVRHTKRWWRELFMATHYAHLRTPDLLRKHLEHKGWTIAQLAHLATNEMVLLGFPDKKVSRQMVSALLQGDRGPNRRTIKTCSTLTAQAIEQALGLPAGVIFDVLEKSSVKRDEAA